MGRNRTPIEKAKLSGAYQKNPARYDERTEPNGGPSLGKAPLHFDAKQKKVWVQFQAELPWLVEADRALVELACITRAQIEGGGDQVTAALMREHRQQLSSMGATSVTRSNVPKPSTPDEDDPFAKFGNNFQ